jgi:hypothetical protein
MKSLKTSIWRTYAPLRVRAPCWGLLALVGAKYGGDKWFSMIQLAALFVHYIHEKELSRWQYIIEVSKSSAGAKASRLLRRQLAGRVKS